MQFQLRDLEQRVKSYWFADGLAEISGGAAFLIIGFYFAFTELSLDAWWGGILQAAFVLVLLGTLFAGRVLIGSLKQRYVYPRTGFVEYKVDPKTLNARRLVAGVTAAAVAAILITFAPLEGGIDWVVALTGAVVGAVLFFGQARRAGLEHFAILGFVSVLMGFLLSISAWPDGYAIGSYYGGMGICFIISGTLAFRRFLRENPAPVEENHG